MSEKATQPKRVLVTGSTGAIGQPLCRHLLKRGHYVRGLSRRPTPGLEDYIMGDLSDQAKVREAVEGMEVVVHLGAYPNDADFLEVLLEPNVRGLFHICDAAREFKVERLILASTLQVVTAHRQKDRNRTVHIEDGPAPVNHYALTKVWAEAMGDMYARVHGISVINARIGWLPRNTEEAKKLAANPGGPLVFLSHDDSDLFFERCVESPQPGPGESATLFATSRSTGQEVLDLEPSRRLIGYEPKDTWPEGLPFPIE
jgi:nucleoside-diphosphate-sugar epimerase